MKTPVKSVMWLLPLMLTACFHRNHKPQNQPVAPPITHAETPVPEPLPPPLTDVTVPAPASATETPPPAKPPEPATKPPLHRKKRVAKPVEQAANDTPGVSAIGQLSSGDPADLRQQTETSIASTERGLKEITRSLSEQEQRTVAQINEFLKQSKAALASGDVDGANTLALKAKVLLGELNR